MAEVIDLFGGVDTLVVCKECGSDTWHFVCNPATEPPVFTHSWCATPDCDVGGEREMRMYEVSEEK